MARHLCLGQRPTRPLPWNNSYGHVTPRSGIYEEEIKAIKCGRSAVIILRVEELIECDDNTKRNPSRPKLTALKLIIDKTSSISNVMTSAKSSSGKVCHSKLSLCGDDHHQYLGLSSKTVYSMIYAMYIHTLSK